jgi:phenylacetic acid degradation operon negative regulatory protein
MLRMSAADALAIPHTGARSLLLTLLGEFVRPHGGSVWTSTIVHGLATVGINERNARQAVARLGEQGIVASERVGRRTRWHLTEAGTYLLDTGAERIYSFGRRADRWDGTWLLVTCAIPESDRTVRNRYRTRLTFEGFGFVSPTIAISPHADRERAADDIVAAFGLEGSAMTFVARSGQITDDAEILATAWDLDDLSERYATFVGEFDDAATARGAPREAVGTTIRLVDAWRRFPFADPELPTDLLPEGWIGGRAQAVFDDARARHANAAADWFVEAESSAA